MLASLPMGLITVGAIILVSGFYFSLRSMGFAIRDKVPFRGFGRTVNVPLRDKAMMVLGTLFIISGLIIAF